MGLRSDKTIIKIISTGGTIEKTYDEENGLLLNQRPVIQEKILSKLRLPHTEVVIQTLFNKDSLDMTDKDRQLLCDALAAAMEESHPIVVIHGTDTVDKSALFCLKNIPQPLVPIIFTGAMMPLDMGPSDAMQNVIEALMAAKLVLPGIYLSFHNQLFKAPHFKKNRAKKTFEHWDP